MSQSPFGQPSPFGAPGPATPPPPAPELEEPAGRNRTKLLVLGGAGLAGIVLAGAAALMLTGGEDLEEDLAAAPKPVAAATPTTTAPAPLPTQVEFAGRNPFKADIVEGGGSAGAGAGTAAPGSTASPTTAPVAGGSGGVTTVFVPGPTVTRTVTQTVPGPTPSPSTVYLTPGEINLVYLGPDATDSTKADFTLNGSPVEDVAKGQTFGFYFQLLEFDADSAAVQFGDDFDDVVKDRVTKF